LCAYPDQRALDQSAADDIIQVQGAVGLDLDATDISGTDFHA